ncbi:acetate and butyrate kinase [Trametes gibbosa]|nr:acetate and butyrate kinase [Trametes gibbosa]
MSSKHGSKRALILAVNAGSSSLKVSLFNRRTASWQSTSSSPEIVQLLLTSTITSISQTPATFSFQLAAHDTGREAHKVSVDDIKDHASAFQHFLDYLKREGHIDRDAIGHVCHRIVHGGDYLEPVVITNKTYHHIERLSDLAPLHNGGALSVMQACIEQLQTAQSIAYFDTSFHRTIPKHITMYPIPQDIAQKRGLKKYGFHGLSYAFILGAVSAFLHKDPSETNLIAMHLGSGASVCAIQNGRSLDTSMGLTPVSGLPGATRSGAIDPALVFHYTNRAGRISHDRAQVVDVRVTEAEEILNTQSGWAAITGTADFGEIVQEMKAVEARRVEGAEVNDDDDEKWGVAFELLVDRILDFVGGYYVKLGGKVDALVFAGGIGEKSADLRQAVAAKLDCLGFAIDPNANREANGTKDAVVDIGKLKDTRRVLVCRTDEQYEMAKECAMDPKFWED